MEKYIQSATKKPVTINYLTWENLVAYGKEKAPESINGDRAWSFEFKGVNITHENDECYIIPTLEGNHNMTPKDVLIIGVKGELYPCKKDIFDLTYDKSQAKTDKKENISTFIERLELEEKELNQKIEALSKAYNSNDFDKKVGNFQYTLLGIQLSLMISYSKILKERIKDILQ